eukprot:TRINITY_DN9127_c0_g1_i1.p1 TRINITY_DN9127_c0_g1~~TRINITY_DN9127_c0_g1_i1.p1  ORF type:complete len:258 (+),score=56.35 TRINITY_DN9127_c0_g1_i1:183-956(+)
MGLLEKLKDNVKQKTGDLIDTTVRKVRAATGKTKYEEASLVEARETTDSNVESRDSNRSKRHAYDSDNSDDAEEAALASSQGLLVKDGVGRREVCEPDHDEQVLDTRQYKPKRITAAAERKPKVLDSSEYDNPVSNRRKALGEDESDLELARAAEMIRVIDMKRGKPVPVLGLEGEGWDFLGAMQRSVSQDQPVGLELDADEQASLNAVTQRGAPGAMEMGTLGTEGDMDDEHSRRPGVMARCCECFSRGNVGFQRV